MGRLRRRGAAALGGLLLAVAATMASRPAPLLVWNASPSSPMGLYRIHFWLRPQTGDIVIAWAPDAARGLAASRRYLPRNVPLVKHAAAAAGDRVCARGPNILVNGRAAARRRLRDPSGRAMPSWSGCRLLHSGELLLLGGRSPLSFDGRYFGVTRPAEIIGVASLIWRMPARGSGHA
jgi:conjugative transfer signal peptidase TraF